MSSQTGFIPLASYRGTDAHPYLETPTLSESAIFT
jgi:hypothetical protein